MNNPATCTLANRHGKQLIVFDCDVVSLTVIEMGRQGRSHFDHEKLLWLFGQDNAKEIES